MVLLSLLLLCGILPADTNIMTHSLTVSTVLVGIIVGGFLLAIATSKTSTATASTRATTTTEATIISPAVTIETVAIIIAIVIVEAGRKRTSHIWWS